MKIKGKDKNNKLRDDLIKSICLYTGDSIGKVLPWVNKYLN